MATDKVYPGHVLFLHATRLPKQDSWQPWADVHRMPDGWLVKFELAGVRPEDVALALQGGRLLVQGTRRDESRCDGVNCYSMEIAYSRFERTLELPGLTEKADVATSYVGGMLLVRIVTEDRK